MLVKVTVPELPLTLAFQPPVTVTPEGRFSLTVQPDELLPAICTSAVNPPVQAFIVMVAVHPLPGVVGLAVVGPAVVGPAVGRPAVVGPAVVGPAVVGLAVVGPAVVGPAVVGVVALL